MALNRSEAITTLNIKVPSEAARRFKARAALEHIPMYQLFVDALDVFEREREQAKASTMDTNLSTKSKKLNVAREDA